MSAAANAGFLYVLNREREKEQKKADAQERPDLVDQFILEAGHEVPIEKFTRQSTVGKIGWAGVEHGWEVKMGEAKYVTAERWVKGAVVPGKEKKHNWVQGHRDGHHFTASSLLMMIDGEVVQDKDEVLIHIDEYGQHAAAPRA